jgi:Ca-activated chloride channel family protein
LEVSVRSRDGRPVTGLTPDDFLILEDNVPQRLVFFSTENPVRLAVTMLVDNSSSVAGRGLERAKAAVAGFLEVLRPVDLVEVISFSDRANLLYPLGPDQTEAKRALGAVRAGGMTRLHEALAVALRRCERAPHRLLDEYRNVIVLLSDGDDTGSVLSFDEVLADARRSGVLVYVMSLRTDRKKDHIVAPPWQMTRLAHEYGWACHRGP